MTKRKRKFTSTTLENWMKEGRGHGEGADYKPWYTIQDVASYGLSHRIKSVWTTGRETHLFSNLERDWFYIFDWAPEVTDIQEQYPLLPLRETEALAIECGVWHPIERRTREGQSIVLTSDFMLTIRREDGIYKQIRTIKYAAQLNNRRVLEKFEVERRYWERRQVDWGILTERELPTQLARNIELLHGKTEPPELPEGLLSEVAGYLTHRVTGEATPLQKITGDSDVKFGLEKGVSLSVAYYLLARRYWRVDMYQPIQPRFRLAVLGYDLAGLEGTP